MSVAATTQKTRCVHCGQDVVSPSFVIEDKQFCCGGCKAVYEILHAANLGAYYDSAEPAGLKPTGDTPDRFAYLDDPTISHRLLDYADASHAQIRLSVPQIHCSACIWLLENLFRVNEGVKRSTVDFVSRRLAVEYDPRAITLAQLTALLARLGYEPDIRLDGLDAKPKRNPNLSLYVRIGVAGFAFANIMLFTFPEYLSSGRIGDDVLTTFFRFANLILAVPVLLYSANTYFVSAWAGIRRRTINLDVPIALGLTALFGRSLWEITTGYGPGYFDSFTGLVFFLLLGKLFQRKTYQWLSFDRDYRAYFPIAVRCRRGECEMSEAVTSIGVGDRLIIRNQELIPADGILMTGRASVDYSFVTGEAEPQELAVGSRVYAGGRQVGGAIEIEVIKTVDQSYLVTLWSNQQSHVGSGHGRRVLSTVTDGVGKYFTTAVLSVAGVTGVWWYLHDPARWALAFTSVLLVACPCAIALSVPFVFGSAMRIFGRNQLFLRDPDVVDALSRIDTIVFDKTGTLTKIGDRSVTYEGRELSSVQQRLVASVARQSTHPASRMVAGMLAVAEFSHVDQYTEVPGQGIAGSIDGHTVRIGRREWTESDTPEGPGSATHGIGDASRVYLSIDGQFYGVYRFVAAYRKGLELQLTGLAKRYQLMVLSGDSPREEEALRRMFGPEAHFKFNQLPHDKRECINQLTAADRRVLMVGDGLNDAGALRAAHVGIAITEDTSAFTPACDGILHGREVTRLGQYLRAAQRARTIVYVSFGISLAYNVIGISVAASGHLSPLISAILMPVSSVSVVLFATGATWFAARREGLG